ncbi:MAG: hypothetical protein K940chlam9_00902 [Chlamydiae bacterium]|nr:hypothetical protein [Chlamydiota bacterium]
MPITPPSSDFRAEVLLAMKEAAPTLVVMITGVALGVLGIMGYAGHLPLLQHMGTTGLHVSEGLMLFGGSLFLGSILFRKPSSSTTSENIKGT